MGYFVNYAYDKTIEKNENYIAVIIGGTGSGKSYSFISFAQQYQKKRKTAHIWIIFEHEELLKLLLPGNDNIKKGDVVIYEEMGISADHRKFWSITNDTIRYVSQIARNRNFLFLMNLPFLNLLDKDVLPLVHFLFETQRKDVEKRVVICKPFLNHVNFREGKSYFKYPMAYVINEWRFVTRVGFPHPDYELKRSNVKNLDEYESIKDEFNNGVYQKLLNNSNKQKMKEDKKMKGNKIDVKEYAEKVIKNKNKFLKKYNKFLMIDMNKISAEFNLGQTSSKMIKKYVESKLGIGYGVAV